MHAVTPQGHSSTLEGLERVSLEKKWILYQFGRPGTKIASKLLPLIVLQKKEKKMPSVLSQSELGYWL